jgi:small subunit ribosomal protein S1
MAIEPGVGANHQAETVEELLAAGIEEDERALRPLRPGEVVEGVVASVSGDDALVDLGGPLAGVVSLREASVEGTDVAVGDRVVAALVQSEGPDGRVVLRMRRVRSRRQGARMTDLAKSGEVVEAEVVEANRGGLVVDVGLRGFVPLSQLASVGNRTATERGAVPQALRVYVGKRLPLKVIEADQRRDPLDPLGAGRGATAQAAGARRRHPQSSQRARSSKGRWLA